MSYATCYAGSNNIHPGFPPLMSDGHFATDWETACRTNEFIRDRAKITNNYDYRQYLIHNADAVILHNQVEACDRCCACQNNLGGGELVRFPHYIFKSCSDKTKPFGYQSSDLKNMYLSRKALQSRLSAPIMTQNEMLLTARPNWN